MKRRRPASNGLLMVSRTAPEQFWEEAVEAARRANKDFASARVLISDINGRLPHPCIARMLSAWSEVVVYHCPRRIENEALSGNRARSISLALTSYRDNMRLFEGRLGDTLRTGVAHADHRFALQETMLLTHSAITLVEMAMLYINQANIMLGGDRAS